MEPIESVIVVEVEELFLTLVSMYSLNWLDRNKREDIVRSFTFAGPNDDDDIPDGPPIDVLERVDTNLLAF